VGYPVSILRRDMEKALGVDVPVPAVIVGAGKLGTALMDYDGFSDYGAEIAAAFDRSASTPSLHGHVPVYPMDQLAAFCTSHHIQTGILTVPASAAQTAADAMTAAGLTAILNFASYPIKVPSGVTVHPVNIALSLAYLHLAASETGKQEEEEQYGTKSI
jgi:redox-sensing transcriptional repressor